MKRNKVVINNAADGDWVINETLSMLKRKEYKLKLRREATCLYCFELKKLITPHDFKVDESYYFEITSNPDAERMLYAISLSQGLKGFLIDTCNVYSDNISSEMVQKLKLNKIRSRKNDFANAGKIKKQDKLINVVLEF
jgi:hypothetical protein